MSALTLANGVKEENRVIELEKNVYFDDTLGRRVATSSVSSLKLRIFLSSSNKDVSPVIDMDRLSILAIENLCNDLPLSNASITVTNSSRNWFNANGLTVSISGGGGSGANAFVSNTQINSTTNMLANVVVDVAGSGYTGTPNVTISGNASITATLSVSGEDRPSGGPANARYITRKVTLADGMDAGDFRVHFAAYKPSAAQIHVYYKILSADDPDTFDSKSYKLMTAIKGYNAVSLNSEDMVEFVFAPGSNNIADDRVQYGSFTSFKYFAIKIVMSTNDTTRVPRIRDFRVIAIPSL
jgi:hypothetical protein